MENETFRLTLESVDVTGGRTTYIYEGKEETWKSISSRFVPMLQAMGYFYINEDKLLEEGLNDY